MARSQLVDDGFWELVKPLLGITPRSTHRAPESVTGQSVHGDHVRAGEWGALAGGLSADQLCSGVSAWRQLWEWQRARVWERVHRELLRHLESRWPDRLVAGSRRLEPHPRPSSGPSPVDRARAGSKHHLLVDAAGVPLAVTLTAGNHNDITQLLPLVDGITAVAERSGITAKRARYPLMS